jgi:predicted ATPase
VVAQLVARTDGVPLFVEELTKTVLESGLLRETQGHYALTGPLPPLAIPATLHNSLMARLDRLETVKAVAQLGAVLGRTFAYELLQAVSPLEEATLQHSLRQLDVRFVSPLPVMQRPACKVWADTRRVQIVWVERSPMLGPDIVDDACD